MFHNTSDDFLELIAEGRISVVGPPLDDQCQVYADLDTRVPHDLEPTRLVPAIGFRSNIEQLSEGQIHPGDFYLGCCHVEFPNLFLVGFARPIIGNIPTISEMQSRYVCSLMAGQAVRSSRIAELHRADSETGRKRFAKLDIGAMYPVEMFPYCDELARRMGAYPSLRKLRSLRTWLNAQLSPATTMHYFADDPRAWQRADSTQRYMP
jgi:dimethylaniline monooxygenase (N-oxide forming)